MKKLFILLFALGFISQQSYAQCSASSSNVEITIESITIAPGCESIEDIALNTAIEPTISLNGTVFTFQPSNSADGGGPFVSNAIPGTYVVSNSDLIDGCSSSTTISIGAAGGSTMVPVNVQMWEEDGCGACSYGTGFSCNDDSDFSDLGAVNVDITQPTGAFSSGCFTFNYAVACPPPCNPTDCSNNVAITFTSVDAGGCDGDPTSTVEAAININGTVYDFSVNDTGNTVVSSSNENCAGTASIDFGVLAAGTSTISLTGIEVWEEDGCGDCSYGTGFGCFDDENYASGVTHTIDLNQIGGSISAGCFTFNYTTSCTSICCLSAGATAGTATCNGNNAIFNVSFNTSDTPTTYEIFDQTNNVVLGSGTSSPILATVTGPTSSSSIDIVVRSQSDPGGCITAPVTIAIPDCPTNCPTITSITSDAAGDQCQDTSPVVNYTLVASSGALNTDYTITWFENGAALSTVVANPDGTATWTPNATGCNTAVEPTVSAQLTCTANGTVSPLGTNSSATITVYPTPDASQVVVTRTDDVCNYTITHPCTDFTVNPTSTSAAQGDANTTISVTVESTSGCTDTFAAPVEACPVPCNITNGNWSSF